MPIQYLFSTVQVLLIATTNTLLTEFLQWLLVYRSTEYKRLKNLISSTKKKIEQAKASGIASKKDKKKDKLEEQVKGFEQKLQWISMKGSFVLMVVSISTVWTFSSLYEGRVMAKLPFEPISFFQGISHRGLPGNDLSDCSFIFLYILCMMALQNLKKFIGLTPKDMPSMFGSMPK